MTAEYFTSRLSPSPLSISLSSFVGMLVDQFACAFRFAASAINFNCSFRESLFSAFFVTRSTVMGNFSTAFSSVDKWIIPSSTQTSKRNSLPFRTAVEPTLQVTSVFFWQSYLDTPYQDTSKVIPKVNILHPLTLLVNNLHAVLTYRPNREFRKPT